PLGIPTWSDKLLQEVIRSLLEAYYEPQFSRHSHGFRAGRGCHTALGEITRHWRGIKWYIEGDLVQCLDRLNHTVLLGILNEQLHDNRFLWLLANLLRAGYLEDWKYHATLSGSPQGGVISPILSNVYLDRLDQFAETVLLPAYNHGDRRKPYPPYMALLNAARRRTAFGARWCSAFWLRNASCAGRRRAAFRPTTSASWLIWTDQVGAPNRSGSSGWRPAAARPWSSASPAMRLFIGNGRNGSRSESRPLESCLRSKDS